ncbi:hypothetical protein [Corticicoccus populi]|uniref:SDR family NAD(P)-dependent oxidoreductase n=1 Tax=Corticicoccus populi TaxID=1812821 RepID=A0ABW5WWV6_9STAP
MSKVIWITGASSGFGFSAAQDLLRYTNHNCVCQCEKDGQVEYFRG